MNQAEKTRIKPRHKLKEIKNVKQFGVNFTGFSEFPFFRNSVRKNHEQCLDELSIRK